MNNKVEFFYFDKYKRKISIEVNIKEFETYKIILLEKSLVENLGDIFYKCGDIIKMLDYYND